VKTTTGTIVCALLTVTLLISSWMSWLVSRWRSHETMPQHYLQKMLLLVILMEELTLCIQVDIKSNKFSSIQRLTWPLTPKIHIYIIKSNVTKIRATQWLERTLKLSTNVEKLSKNHFTSALVKDYCMSPHGMGPLDQSSRKSGNKCRLVRPLTLPYFVALR